MKLHVFGLLCLVASTEALFGRKDQRRRLSETAGTPVDVDAATGTVLPVETQDSSCNGQLAEALVRANAATTKATEERDAALTQVNDFELKMNALEREVQEMRTAANAAKEDAAKALEQKSTIAAERDAALHQAQQAESKISELQRDIDELHVSADSKAKELAQMKEQIEMSQSEVAVTFSRQLEEAYADRDAKVAELQAKLDVNAEEHQRILEDTQAETKTRAEEQMTLLRSELEDTRMEAQKHRDRMVKEHKEEIEYLKNTHQDAIKDKEGFIKGLEHEMEILAGRVTESVEVRRHYRS